MPARRRSFLIALFSAIGALVAGAAKAIFDYSAAPTTEKQSDFVFPTESAPEATVSFTPKTAEPSIPFAQRGGFVNDASHLNRTAIYGMAQPRNEDEIRQALGFARANGLKIVCAGERHSMGGQSLRHNGLLLDLRKMDCIMLDEQHKTVNVQSGARWWQIQEALDNRGFAVKAMQSINIFSVGGTLSVNAHGMDPDPGPIAPTVQSLRVMLHDGSVVRASASENPEIFRHVLGGYGLVGVILDADLDVSKNEMYALETSYMDFKEFPPFYQANVERNESVGLAFGRLSVAPASYLRETAMHIYRRTHFEGELPSLEPQKHEAITRLIVNLSKTGGAGRWLRWTMEKRVEPMLHSCATRNTAMVEPATCEVSRNEEMHDRMAYLQNRLPDTDILQEYFIAFARMPQFIDSLREIVQRNGANLLNVTIRIVHRDTVTALPYAKEDMFAFVLYFNVRFNERDNRLLEHTTSELIDAAYAAGGTFYLPYQLFYTKEQLRRAYPEVDAFFTIKTKYDPDASFSNKFYEKYGV